MLPCNLIYANLELQIITRSTFPGAGANLGKWLGDNFSLWTHYRFSIAGMLNFAAIFQVPMVGSDVCGFGLDTTETLCARWATLGAFNPFYRNHNGDTSISQEFYRSDSVAKAAKNAITIRYKLLDYIYTALQKQTIDGTPILNPLFFLYPSDSNTFGIDLQFFYGDAILVSPVTEENSTTVAMYLPNDLFYDYHTSLPIKGNGTTITLHDVGFDTIPLHIRAGTIIPQRVESANTTTELRKKNFEVLVAPALDGTAKGSLYLDDGVSLVQKATSDINFIYADRHFWMDGTFEYEAGVEVERVIVLGVAEKPVSVMGGDSELVWTYDAETQTLTIQAGWKLDGGAEVSIR